MLTNRERWYLFEVARLYVNNIPTAWPRAAPGAECAAVGKSGHEWARQVRAVSVWRSVGLL